MRIAICLFKYFPYGGLQRDFLRLAKSLAYRGNQITVYTMSWTSHSSSEQLDFLTIKVIPKKYYSNHKNAANFSKVIQAEIQKNQYDLVIGFNKIAGLDWYYCADSCYVAKNHEQKSKLINKIYSFTRRYQALKNLESDVFQHDKKTKILFLSANEQKNYQKYYDLDSARCFLLPPQIQKNRFSPITDKAIKNNLKIKLAESLNINPAYDWLLMVGSGFKTKGVDRSIRLLKYLLDNNYNERKICLLVVGQDNPKTFIKLAAEFKIQENIVFLSGREDVADFMAVSTLLLHPAYRENTGTVIIESIIMGLPVIVSQTCGYSNYVQQSGCGIVIPEPFNQDYYNNAVSDVLKNNPNNITSMAELGLNFRENVEIYSGDQKILEYLENK